MTRQCWCLCMWAWSPKVEAKILLQSWQGTAVLGFCTLFFLADLLSSRLCSRLLSKCFVPLRIAALQAGRSWVATRQLGCCRLWGSISAHLCTTSSARLCAVFQLRAQHGTVVLGVCCCSCDWHVLTSEAVPGSTWLQYQWAQPCEGSPGLAHGPSSWHGELCEGSAGRTGPVSWYAACS